MVATLVKRLFWSSKGRSMCHAEVYLYSGHFCSLFHNYRLLNTKSRVAGAVTIQGRAIEFIYDHKLAKTRSQRVN